MFESSYPLRYDTCSLRSHVCSFRHRLCSASQGAGLHNLMVSSRMPNSPAALYKAHAIAFCTHLRSTARFAEVKGLGHVGNLQGACYACLAQQLQPLQQVLVTGLHSITGQQSAKTCACVPGGLRGATEIDQGICMEQQKGGIGTHCLRPGPPAAAGEPPLARLPHCPCRCRSSCSGTHPS